MSDTFPPENYISVASAINGIDVFKPAPPREEEQRDVVEFNCPQCGATTAFSVKDGGLTCSHCGFYEPPKTQVVGKQAEQFEFTTETMERAARGWGEARKELECQNCGSRTSIPVESLTYTCVFCGSNKVIQREAVQDMLRPRFLIPFKVESDKCGTIAQQWLESSWMVPQALSRLASLQAFTGVYLPFWTFDTITQADWKAEVGHQETERYYDAHEKEWRSRTVTVWRWESGRVRLNIDDLLVEGTTHLSALLLGQVKNYNLSELVPYDARFLAGLQARAYDVPLDAAWEKGRQEMREQTRRACRDQASTAQIRNFSMTLDFRDESWRYILLPIYVAAYSYEKKIYQVMVNAQTGTIAGQRPVDWTKVWLVIAALLVPGLLLGLVGLMTLPIGGVGVAIGGVGFILLVIGVVIAVIIGTKAQRLDDA
jgi:ribosomal protein L37E